MGVTHIFDVQIRIDGDSKVYQHYLAQKGGIERALSDALYELLEVRMANVTGKPVSAENPPFKVQCKDETGQSASSFGERLKYYRKLKGLTQKQLGLMLGCEERSAAVRVGQYETGARHPNEVSLQQLATALGVEVDALLGKGCHGCQYEEGYAARHKYPCNACVRNTELFGDNYEAKEGD